MRLIFLDVRETTSRQKRLVNFDRVVHLTTLSQQTAESDMRLKGLGVDRQCLAECFQR